MTIESYRFGVLHPGASPRRGEIPSNPVVVDLDEILEMTTNENEIVPSMVTNLWAELCGHDLADKNLQERVRKSVKSKLREGYFTVKGQMEYVFFLGINGKIYPHNYPSSVQCTVTDSAGYVTGIGTGQPHPAVLMLYVVQQLLRDWHLKNLKNGHRERVKDRVININKQG